jgi:hypothetical protein
MTIINDDLRDMRISIIFSFALILFVLACLMLPSKALPAMFGQSHVTHWWDDKGPDMWDGSYPLTCDICHIDNSIHHDNPVLFNDGNVLADTTVCDNCHSENGAYDGVAMAKSNWDSGIYTGDDLEYLQTGKEKWCVACHDDVPANSKADGTGINAPNIAGDNGDNGTFGFYVNGHKTRLCSDCHDLITKHIDGEHRTYSFDTAYYGPSQSGIAYASGYRLKYIDGQVPLMIPANYGTTFGYNSLTMKNNAFRLCFDCHDSSKILDDVDTDGLDTNFKASLPNPPRNYSYAWSSGEGTNEHVTHIMNYTMADWDSDWDTGTTGPGPGDYDSMRACSSCHNVHGAATTEGSTNEPMIRDGSLAGRTGYGFSYVIEDVLAGGYPWVTSTGATQQTSVGAIFRNNTANMCGGSMCHDNPAPPAGSSYNASGSGWGTYVEYYRVPQVYLEFLAECPVDIQVVDPLGRIVDKFQNEIQGAEYFELDFNNDGSLDDKIIVPKLNGTYTISVFPEPGANPEDTYTLTVTDGANILILVKDAPVGNISGEYITEVTVTSSGLKFIKLLTPMKGEYLLEPVTFDWESVGCDSFKLQFSTDEYFSKRVLTLPRGPQNSGLGNFREHISNFPGDAGNNNHQRNWISETDYVPTDLEWLLTKRLMKWPARPNMYNRWTVYWRVIATDAEGNTVSSEIRSFILKSFRFY